MSWIEDKPERSDLIRDFGPLVRSQKTEFRAAVEKHFFWTESSGLSAGEPNHQVASTATGSCRAFFGTASEVSASRDGQLMVTSDTTRLYALTSASSVMVGAAAAVTNPLTGSSGNLRVLVQSDELSSNFANGTFNISFPVEYGAAPTQLVIQPRFNANNEMAYAVISDLTAGGFEFKQIMNVGANALMMWRSVGTVAI